MGLLSKLVMPGLVPGIHVLSALKQGRRGWPGKASGSDAVLRTAMPGHDEKRLIFKRLEKSPKMLDAFSVRLSG
jgi:hypothetical protein